MMKKHKKNSIWNRLKMAFVIILCLPVLGLGSYMIYSSIKFVKDERLLETAKLIELNILDLNNRMEQCENSLIYVASNYTLQEFLQMDTYNFLKVNQASRNVGPFLYNVILSNQYYKKLKVYSEKDFSVMNDLIENVAQVSSEEWYQKTLETSEICWWHENGKTFISRKIVTSYPVKTVGVIRAELKDKLFEGSFRIFENIPIKVRLNDEILFYEGEDWSDSYYAEERALLAEEWVMKYEVDKDYFYPKTGMTLLIPAMIIILVLVIAIIAVRVALGILVKEVDYLVEKVEEVKGGNLEVTICPVRTDELNILAVSINEMLERIRQLIQRVYQTEVEQKELELEVLRSKISPHFLYNNLSAINWIAIERDEKDIYEITTQMAAFYRTALNKGKNIDKLRLEITNIRAYINLQLISHENSFDVFYEIDDGLLECVIPTFILQPLVENAIEHGIDLLRDQRGKLVIRVFREEKVLHLQVEDNGTELYREIGDATLGVERYGYGTGNVNRRIQLVHGEDYGLKIYASKNGTLSELRLKIDEIGITALSGKSFT